MGTTPRLQETSFDNGKLIFFYLRLAPSLRKRKKSCKFSFFLGQRFLIQKKTFGIKVRSDFLIAFRVTRTSINQFEMNEPQSVFPTLY